MSLDWNSLFEDNGAVTPPAPPAPAQAPEKPKRTRKPGKSTPALPSDAEVYLKNNAAPEIDDSDVVVNTAAARGVLNDGDGPPVTASIFDDEAADTHPATAVTSQQTTEAIPEKKRGRPAGSQNKKKKEEKDVTTFAKELGVDGPGGAEAVAKSFPEPQPKANSVPTPTLHTEATSTSPASIENIIERIVEGAVVRALMRFASQTMGPGQGFQATDEDIPF